MSKITAEHLCRSAIIYVRQSTSYQVVNNLESQRRQYGLDERARLSDMAKSLERDPQLESLLANRKKALGIQVESGRRLAQELAFNHGIGLGRGRGIGL